MFNVERESLERYVQNNASEIYVVGNSRAVEDFYQQTRQLLEANAYAVLLFSEKIAGRLPEKYVVFTNKVPSNFARSVQTQIIFLRNHL